MYMKKIVFYYPLIIIGGVEVAIYNLIQKLHKEYDITIVFDRDDGDIEMLLKMSKYATVKKIDDEIKCDTCVFCSVFKETDKIQADNKILWVHGNLEEMKFKYYLRQKHNNVVTVSKECGRQFYNVTNKDNIVILNELDDDMEKLAKEEVNIPKAKINLVTVSRISHQKGFDRMVKFVERLEERKIDYKWIVVGEGHDKRYEADVKRSLKNYSNVIFIGKQTNPYPYIKNADYLVQLSDAESFCFAMAQAFKLGTPCILTNYKTAKEFIGDNGYLLDLNICNIDEVINQLLNKPIVNFTYPSEAYKWRKIL